MPVSTEEKKTKNTVCEPEELDYKIEIATQTLDRNIGFVTNCDNKTSIILTAVGVLLTIILTNEGINKAFYIIKSCIGAKTFCSIFYLLCFAGSIFIMALGMFKLGSVLMAKTSEDAVGRKDATSRIFFSGIRKSGDCKTYRSRFYSMNREELLNELIEQIYINADIATQKYEKYNLGIKCTIIGFVLFVAILLIGIYLY